MTEKTNIDDIIGIVKTEEKTDSVELKKEYYKSRMTENKRYYLGNGKLLTVCDSNKGGSDGFNGLTQYEVVDLLNEQEERIKELKRKKERYKRLSEIRDENINNYILSLKEFINDCEDEKVKNILVGLLYSEVKEYDLAKENRELKEENQRLIKMLDNIANYIQKQHKDIPIDDFVEWWNNIATEGL